MMGSEKFDRFALERHGTKAVIRFGGDSDPNRRIAGVSAAARIVRELDEAGIADIRLATDAPRLSKATEADIARIAPDVAMGAIDEAELARLAAAPAGILILSGRHLVSAEALRDLAAGRARRLILHGEMVAEFASPRAADAAAEADPELVLPLDPPWTAAAAILKRTGKSTDGPISRLVNRPVSRRISALLLNIDWLRPQHLTFCTALVALAMILAFLLGGHAGLVAGGVLFQAASVLDGVDGEMARATFRTSERGAALDGAVDMVTNLLFCLGVTVNLAMHRGGGHFAMVGGTAFAELGTGLAILAWLNHRSGGPVSFDTLKTYYSEKFVTGPGLAVTRFITIMTSRDFFAFGNCIFILVGVGVIVPYCLAICTTVWLFFILLALPDLLAGDRQVAPE